MILIASKTCFIKLPCIFKQLEEKFSWDNFFLDRISNEGHLTLAARGGRGCGSNKNKYL